MPARVLGRGMGLTKPAELNRYPGPLHALELTGELQLSTEQRNSLEASKARIGTRAKALGAEILDLERELDAAFAHCTIDLVRLNELTAQIGAKQAMLRRRIWKRISIRQARSRWSRSRDTDILRGYGSVPSAGQDGHGTKHH